MIEPMKHPGAGTGIWIRKDKTVLLGKRIGKSGANTWCPPGGKLEMYEDIQEHVLREVTEECGIEIENVRFLTFTNDRIQEWGTHFISLNFVADWESGVPRDEPGKIAEWGWYEWDALPEPLFIPTRNFVNLGYNPLNF